MSMPSTRAIVRANAVSCLSGYRDQIAARMLAERHPRLSELSVSFPALFAVLAVPRARFDPEPAIVRVIAGAPLAIVATEARVPMWLRKLAPQMCPTPLPALPDSLYLRRRIVNHLPRKAGHAELWFDAVSDAAERSTQAFMVWCARLVSAGGRRPIRRQNLLGLWAWFSERPGTQAHALIDTPWSPEMEFKVALIGAEAWLKAVKLHLYLGDSQVADPWFSPGVVDGYDFVPLDSGAAIAAEAAAMENCLLNYGGRVANDRVRLWSLRKDGQRVATMNVGWGRQDPLPVVWEMKLARNREAPAELWLAARRWLLAQDLLKFDRSNREPDVWRDLEQRRWVALWRPYWLDRRRFPDWLPLKAAHRVLSAL